MSTKVARQKAKISIHSKVQDRAKVKISNANEAETSKSKAPDEQDSQGRSNPDAGRRFMRDLGIDDRDFYVGFAKQIVAVNSDGKHSDEINSNFDLAFVRGAKPRDQIESALAMQMAATHRLIMGCTRRLLSATNPFEIQIYGQILTKLNRTFIAQMEALKIYRRSDDPGVTVQNVSVRDGGQAIVGKITQHGRAAPDATLAPPPAAADEKIAPIPLVSKPEPVFARLKREE
jgi:hypothetical protein